jgi:hypothetical protein
MCKTDEETLNQAEIKTGSIKKEENEKCTDVKRSESKAALCCPHLFRQTPVQTLNYHHNLRD